MQDPKVFNTMVLWSEEYCIGIKEIDAQHKKFVELAKPLFQAEDLLSKERIKEILYALREYMKRHFQEEEKYMQAVGFDALSQHIKQHEGFVQELATVVHTPAKLPIIQAKIKVIIKKFIKHIQNEDLKIKVFVEKKKDKIHTQEIEEEIFEL